jgi:hypothetical protein
MTAGKRVCGGVNGENSFPCKTNPSSLVKLTSVGVTSKAKVRVTILITRKIDSVIFLNIKFCLFKKIMNCLSTNHGHLSDRDYSLLL